MVRVGARFQSKLDGRVFSAVIAASSMNRPPAAMRTELRDLEAIQKLIASPAALGIFDLPFMPIFFIDIFMFHPALGWAAVAGAGFLILLTIANHVCLRSPGVLTLGLLIGGVGGWSVFTQINGAVVAMGQIEVDQNRQVVQHPDGGIVDHIRVREGDEVSAGDLLVSLDDQTIRSELSVVENQLFEAIARRGRHEAEQQDSPAIKFDVTEEEAGKPEIAAPLDGQATLFDARRVSSENQKQQLSHRHEQIDSQILGIMSQKTALEKQLSLIDDELKSQQTLLDRGLAQSARVSELARTKANLEGQVGQLMASIAESEGRKTEIDLSILKVDSDRREEAISDLRDLQTKEAQLIERRIELQRELDRTQIKAPVSGIVYGLNVFAPKSVIKPADPIMFLVPQDRPLVISARIEVKDIDQLRFN